MPNETGTVITLAEEPGQQTLWGQSLSYFAVEGNTAEAGRCVEILLDCVAQEACDEAPYILDRRYAGALDDDERVLAEKLQELATSVRGLGPSARAVCHPLQELGH